MIENAVPQKKRSVTLLVLCVLTILGNILIVLKGLITYYALYRTNDDRQEAAVTLINAFYFLELLTCLGSVSGAVLMIAGKKSGLITYLISSLAYMVMTAVFAVVCFFSIIGIPVALLQIIYLVPSVVFFILYLIYGRSLF